MRKKEEEEVGEGLTKDWEHRLPLPKPNIADHPSSLKREGTASSLDYTSYKRNFRFWFFFFFILERDDWLQTATRVWIKPGHSTMITLILKTNEKGIVRCESLCEILFSSFQFFFQKRRVRRKITSEGDINLRVYDPWLRNKKSLSIIQSVNFFF